MLTHVSALKHIGKPLQPRHNHHIAVRHKNITYKTALIRQPRYRRRTLGAKILQYYSKYDS